MGWWFMLGGAFLCLVGSVALSIWIGTGKVFPKWDEEESDE